MPSFTGLFSTRFMGEAGSSGEQAKIATIPSVCLRLQETGPALNPHSLYLRLLPQRKPLMKKIYHMANGATSQAIIRATGIDKMNFEMQDIKFEKITPAQLEEMKKMAGSYEVLFRGP
jgi:hypothetical protein